MNDSNEIEQGTPAQSLFFQTLHRMLTNESHTDCIDWLPDGNGFVVLLKQEFSDDVLPRYFGQAKYSSFTRRLKRWGFRRVANNAGAFYHDKFKRNMVLDLDLELESTKKRPSIPSDSNSKPKSLPLKKRKWIPPPPAPFEAHHLSRHDVSPSAQHDDVKVMPDLMRTINKKKRKEKKEEDKYAASPTTTTTSTEYQEIAIKMDIRTLDQSMEAAQTLASLNRQESTRKSFDRLVADNQHAVENFRLGHSLYSRHTNLERGMKKPQSKVRHVKRNWDGSASGSYSCLYQNKEEECISQFSYGLCQLTSDSRRVPIPNPKQRETPAFNRAA